MYYAILAFVIGVILGKEDQRILRKIKELNDRLDKQEVGPSLGVYGTVNSLTMTPTETGASMPKTPTQLEWEEAERLRRAQMRIQ
jgi:hypothetical protein